MIGCPDFVGVVINIRQASLVQRTMQIDIITRVFVVGLVIAFTVCWSQSALCQDALSDYNDWPAGIAARQDLSDERSYDYDFSKISVKTLKTWLGRVGIKIPVELDGELSGWVWAQRSANGWLDFRNYKIEGEIRSQDLKIDNWRVKEANVRFGYAGGDWYVGEIAGELRSAEAESPIGIVDARAKILTATSSIVEVAAKVDSIDLKALLQSFGLEVEIQNSGGSVSLVGAVPIATASDLSTWKANADIAVDDVVLPWIDSRGKALAALKLAEGNWELINGQIKIAEQDLKLAGKGKLDSELPFELSVSGGDLNASQLLQQLKNPELANQLEGSIQLTATVNGNQSDGIAHAVAAIESKLLDVRSQPIENLKVVADYGPRGIQLDIASAELAGGTVTGVAKWRDVNEVIRGIPSHADLQLKTLQLENLVLVELPVSVSGQASGEFGFGMEKTDGLEDWNSTGQLKINRLKAAGTGFGDAILEWKKELSSNQLNGNATLHQGSGSVVSNVVLEFDDAPDSSIHATTFRRYRADGELKNYDLVARIGSDSSVIIPIQALGTFSISGSPNNWLERGKASLSNSLAKFGDRVYRLEIADLSFNELEYRVERFRLLDAEGRVAGSATFRRDHVGEHSVRLHVVDMPLQVYLQQLVPKSLNSIDGVAAAELEFRSNAANDDPMSDWSGRMNGNLSSLKFQGKPIGDLNFRGDIANQLVTANIDGQLIGGDAKATLKLPLSVFESSQPNSMPAKLDVTITKVQAKRVAEFLFEGKFARQVLGSVSVEFTAEATSDSDLIFDGKIELPNVKLQRKSLAHDLTAKLKYADGKLSFERLAGGFAGGRIDARGHLNVDGEDVSNLDGARFNFVAQRLDIKSLVSMVYPEYAKYYSGALDYRGAAIYRRGIQLNGTATAKNGSLFGIPIQIARGKLRTEFNKNGEFARAVSRNLHGTGIGGSFEAEVDIRSGSNYSLATHGKVFRGKLEQLSRAIGSEKIVGSGTFNGSFELNSDRIESVAALTGALQIDFENGDVNSIPLLSSIDRFVPLAQFASTDIENGRLNARIGQGQLRISDLIINSRAFLLAANGNASLDASRLDLEVVVQTGGSIQQQLTKNAFERLLTTSVPQVAAISEFNELIRNRTVFLHIGGSTSRPVIQARPAQTAAKAFFESFGRGIFASTPTANQ